MPNKVIVMRGATLDYETDDYIKERYVAFAYPGMYVGCGETMEEALQMAKMRLRNIKNKFLETHIDAIEADWTAHARDRQHKIEEVYRKMGLTKESVWASDNVEKKKE